MNVAERAARIKLLLLDVDGVLTDGRIMIGNYGDEIKSFDINDGLGIVFLKRAGVSTVILTANNSRIVKSRAKQLGITRIYSNHYKIKCFDDILRRYSVRPEEVCFAGDDVIDIPILKRIGLAVAVPNAMEDVKSCVHYITSKSGGRGAVREVCELILKARGDWDRITRRYFE